MCVVYVCVCVCVCVYVCVLCVWVCTYVCMCTSGSNVSFFATCPGSGENPCGRGGSRSGLRHHCGPQVLWSQEWCPLREGLGAEGHPSAPSVSWGRAGERLPIRVRPYRTFCGGRRKEREKLKKGEESFEKCVGKEIGGRGGGSREEVSMEKLHLLNVQMNNVYVIRCC